MHEIGNPRGKWHDTYKHLGNPESAARFKDQIERAQCALMIGLLVLSGYRSLLTGLARHSPIIPNDAPIAWCVPTHVLKVDPASIVVLGRQQVVESVVRRRVNGVAVHTPAIANRTWMEVTGVDETAAPHSAIAPIEALLQFVQPRKTCKIVDTTLGVIPPGIASPYETNFSIAANLINCPSGQHLSGEITPSADRQLHVVENDVALSCE